VTTREMKKAGLDELLNTYRDAARTHETSMEVGDFKKGNKAADLIAQIYSELRHRGEEAQNVLLPLLQDEHAGVRGWAASHALEFAPEQGEPVLEALVSFGGLIGMTASTTLTEWKKGRLRFP